MCFLPDISRERASSISNVIEKIAFRTADSAVEKARKVPRSLKDITFNKYVVLHALQEAKILGPGPYRTFESMLSFLPGQSLTDESDQPYIIYAKNENMRKRAGGIGDSTVRAHISLLVKCGILERKTGLNHKRCNRQNGQSLALEIFRLSVAPLVRRFDELGATAKQQRARHDALKLSIRQLRTKM